MFTCKTAECFDFSCHIRNEEGSGDIGFGEFAIDNVVSNTITGKVVITDVNQQMTNFDYECSSLVP